MVQGQFLIPLFSDPLGKGWDLLGTAEFQPNIAPFSPNTIWYVQAGALVVGHVAGARDRARPGGRAVPRPARGAALPVRDAGADGRLHGRWVVAALAPLIGHGGLSGALAEIALAVLVAGGFAWIWLRERRRSRLEGPAEMRDDVPLNGDPE